MGFADSLVFRGCCGSKLNFQNYVLWAPLDVVPGESSTLTLFIRVMDTSDDDDDESINQSINQSINIVKVDDYTLFRFNIFCSID